MIPDVRLMFVALLASVVAISCALGLFAAFRVNHDQFARAPNGSPLLQLAFVAPASVTDAKAPPIAVRLQINVPAPAAVPSSSGNAPAIMPPPIAVSDSRQEIPQPAEKRDVGDVAAAPPADQSPQANSTAPDADTQPSVAAAEAAPTAEAVKKTTRNHAVRSRRPVQPQAAALPVSQFGSFPQPATPQPVRRRLVVRHRHPAQPTAAATAGPQQTVVESAPAGPSDR